MTTVAETVLDPVVQLRRDIKKAAADLTDTEARYLVDYYYIVQEDRKRAGNQVRSMEGEPHGVLTWLFEQARTIENTVKGVLGVYAQGQLAGRWAQSICGIGPVISAGLLAHIDIERAPTVGHIWSFAGLNPNRKWLGKEKAKSAVAGLKDVDAMVDALALAGGFDPVKLRRLATNDKGKVTKDSLVSACSKRPYNAELKTLCWHIGECFVKVSGNNKDTYGKVYVERKELEIARNDAGEFKDQAADQLKRFNYSKSTDAYKHYIEGRLPPAHIHARAKRYAAKLFLSHFHQALYRQHFKKDPPKPYIIEHGGHTHFVELPDPAGIFKDWRPQT